MNDKFDELARGLAQSVTRRAALKKFGVGLAGVVLATLGLANKTQADPNRNSPHGVRCSQDISAGCARRYPVGSEAYLQCVGTCFAQCSQGAKYC